MNERCRERVMRGYSAGRCQRVAGQSGYCKTHDPELRAKRYAVEEEKWKAEFVERGRISRLNSAAPEMLSALKSFVRWYEEDSTEFNRDTALFDAKKAIAKAEGTEVSR